MTATSERIVREPAAERSGIPGEPGLWLFLFADLVVFALMFGVIVHLRNDQPVLFAESQSHLNESLGVLNTVVLLTGSLFVAAAVRDVRARVGRPDRLLLGAVACGVLFVVVKSAEWASTLADGITPSTNDFFGTYFMLTGIHLLHVMIGIGVLLVMLHNVRSRERRLRLVEGGACYWHLVDLLWVVLFPLLYLMPAGSG